VSPSQANVGASQGPIGEDPQLERLKALTDKVEKGTTDLEKDIDGLWSDVLAPEAWKDRKAFLMRYQQIAGIAKEMDTLRVDIEGWRIALSEAIPLTSARIASEEDEKTKQTLEGALKALEQNGKKQEAERAHLDSLTHRIELLLDVLSTTQEEMTNRVMVNLTWASVIFGCLAAVAAVLSLYAVLLQLGVLH